MAVDNFFVVKNGLQVEQINLVSPNKTNTISINMLDSDTLSFSGNSGQLFSITDTMDGTIFAVNDISGVPSIEVEDSGTIRFAESFGNVLVGTATNNGVDKLQVNGGISSTTLATTGNVTVGGNLTVNGTTTTINTEIINLADNVIVLNSNYTGSTPTENAGIEIERGTLANVSFLWDETVDRWTVGSNEFVSNGLYIGTTQVVNSSGQWVGANTGLVGFTGSKGEIGFTGSKGDVGFTGSKGDVGFTGSKGDVGFTGSKGDIGFTGSVGYTGSKGDVGFTGSKGDVGFTGSKGDVGFTGSKGDIGFTGSRGTDGTNGTNGTNGDTGFTGSKGDVGFTGSKGDVGFTGSKGDVGFTGSKGDIGFTGSVGYTGSVGIATVNDTTTTTQGDLNLDFTLLSGTLSATGSSHALSTASSPTFTNLTLSGDLTVQGGDIIASGASFNLVNTTVTTVNLAGAATTLAIGNTATAAQTVNMFTASTGASTYNFATGATATATTKTLNIGTGGAAGSTTNINIGSSIGGTTTVNNNLTVGGNLTVSGTTTTINTETINLADNIIVLNSNYTGATPTENAGIEIERGTLTNVVLQWNETSDFWEIASGGTTGRILTTGDEGTGNNLDADTVDGVQATSFLRSDAIDNYTSGTLTFDSGTTLTAAAGATVNFNNATTTAPFTVASTTVVTNLNSDYLDGQHGLYYQKRVATTSTPPSSPIDGDLWWDDENGRLFIYYDDGTSVQWVEASPSSTNIQFDTATSTYTMAGNLIVTGDINSASDVTLKENIITTQDALDKTLLLRGVNFDWKNSGKSSIGLIAQEVEQVLPELVSTDANGIKSVQYSNIVAILIEAIKEQNNKIAYLEEVMKDIVNGNN